MKFKIILITLILPCISNLFPKAKTKEKTIKWSDYQGKMNWNDAKTKCLEIGMRLPSLEELKTAYTAKVTEDWKTDGKHYWSSKTYGDENANIFLINEGVSLLFSRNFTYHVRCIRW